MKTTLLILFSGFLLFQFTEKKKMDFENDSIILQTELDTLRINWYLNDPIDYAKIEMSNIIITKADSISKTIPGKRIEYNYFSADKRIGEMKGFHHKVDSMWQFGHSGWFMNSFKCESEELPLKFDLKVGSNIDAFIEFFGKPNKRNLDFIYYDFSGWRSMKKLRIYTENKKVSKLEITTANNVYK
ncbi:hypothetical protein ELS83_21065 [Marinifilum sp. JC070]|uniref:Uncharacterized protein n=2 Tax=Marinifilum caeruleilacunae TaxID=2499076 RepID=A0ABX1X1N7_9BACT|nr:hypothetical protein [Marinifilum caeruleilacunae]